LPLYSIMDLLEEVSGGAVAREVEAAEEVVT
jgi:hypothetical protein